MDFDDVLEDVGEFGIWQIWNCALLWIPSMIGGIHVLMYSFTGTRSPIINILAPQILRSSPKFQVPKL